MSKKPAAKQVSIAAFFSPQAAKSAAPASPVRSKTKDVVAANEEAVEADAAALKTPPPAKAAAASSGKRKRGGDAKPRAKKKILAAEEAEDDDDADEGGGEGVVDLTASVAEKSAKKRGRPAKEKAPATKRKTPVAKKAKTPAEGKAKAPVAAAAASQVRFGVSPHERTGDDEDDVSDDDEEEETKQKPVQEEIAAEKEEEEVEKTKTLAVAAEKEETEDTIEFEPIATPEPTKPRKAPASAKAKKVSTKASAAIASVISLVSPATSPQKPQPPPVPAAEPVDPVVRARIASYQQKIDELTRLCDRLSHSRAADDAVLQEIYGLGLDVELDAAAASDDERDAWRQLGDSTTSELPATLKRFVARATQSRSDSLTQLVTRIAQSLGSQSNNATSTLALEMEIKMLAQRTSYGARQAKANLYEDTTPEALWCWEVNNVDLYFEDDAQKTIKRLRKQRKRTGTQLKSLNRVVQLLHHTPTIDEAKVSQEEAKIGKFVSQVESELQKARDREKKENDKVRKEQEKAQALEEKKRAEHEKLLAKEEEKKKKELEAEAEKLLAEKRKKSLVSYFRSIDTLPEPGATAAGATSASVVGAAAGVGATAVAVGAGGRLTLSGAAGAQQRAKMARMDREVSFFVQEDIEVEDVTPSSPSRSGKTQFERRRGIVTARVGHWSSRQHRDAKLGVMKMLQFHENYRPAYYGTFSKRSSTFRRGRRPFAQYAKFDYSVDSEEEWEEEEPGESLSGADSDMDGEDDDDQLDYGDDWLAYEDEVEYVDGEQHDEDDVVMDDDADGDDESANSQAAAASRKRRRKRVAAENKKQKLTKLTPEIRGPFVCLEVSGCDHLASLAGELLDAVSEFVSPLMKRAEAREEAAAAALLAAQQQQQQQQTQTQGTDETAAAATTPVVKKKAKTPKKAAVAEAPATATATATTATPTTHKPPVKRKISPQLVTAASNGSSDAPAKPKAVKKATDAPASQQAVATPKVSPVKSGITGWLKAPVATTTTTSSSSSSSSVTEPKTSIESASSAAETTGETVAPVKAPVEI